MQNLKTESKMPSLRVTHFLVYSINGWGTGASEEEARANFAKHNGGTRPKVLVLETFDIAADTPEERKPRCGGHGGVEYWPGQKRLGAWRINGTKRTALGH